MALCQGVCTVMQYWTRGEIACLDLPEALCAARLLCPATSAGASIARGDLSVHACTALHKAAAEVEITMHMHDARVCGNYSAA